MSDGDIDERLSRRFGNDENEEGSTGDRNEGGGSSSENEKNDKNAGSAKNEKNDKSGWDVDNVKTDWTPRSIYLPDSIDSSLDRTYKRLDLEIDEADLDREFRKTRHFYPLLVALGIERIREMEVAELVEFLESLESKERKDES